MHFETFDLPDVFCSLEQSFLQDIANGNVLDSMSESAVQRLEGESEHVSVHHAPTSNMWTEYTLFC